MNITDKQKDQLLERLDNIANHYDVEKDIYAEMYSYYLDFFETKNEIKVSDMVIGIGFTYSWMPTILKKLKLENKDKAVIVLNRVKDGHLIDENDLNLLMTVCNNSLVGTSKLLHFINPKKYAIWDSRVYRFLYDENVVYKYKLDMTEKYLEYLIVLKEFSSDLKFQKVISKMRNKMQNKFEYQISDFRALEMMFFNGDKYGIK